MTVRHRSVQVRIEKGALWVDADVYPLRNISHVGRHSLPGQWGEDNSAARDALTRKMKRVALWGGLLVLVTFGLLILPVGGYWLDLYYRRNNLVDWPTIPALHALIISTAGTQQATVWSTSRGEIDYLVQKITTAINNPDVAQLVCNMQNSVTVSGDYIEQHGMNSVGKASHFGPGNISAGG